MSSSKPRVVLILAYHFPPENCIASDRPFRFYKYLPGNGYDVHVVTASTQDPQNVRHNVSCAPAESLAANTRRMARVLGHLLRPLINENSYGWALAAYDAGDKIIREHKPDLIFSTSPPVISNVVAGLLARRHGIPWVADFRDPVAGNPDRKHRGVGRLRDVAVENWIFRSAHGLIANTDSALEMWKRNYPQCRNKMHLIWNGFDPDESLAPLEIPQRSYKVLIHAGGVNDKRHPRRLLESVLRLIRFGRLSSRSVRIRLIGPVSTRWSQIPDVLGELVRLQCLEYDGRLIPRADARKEMAAADGLILLDLPPRGEAVQVPGKIFDYIRIGRPILASTTPNSPAERLLNSSGIPHLSIYPDDDDEQVDSKLLQFLSLPNDNVVAGDWFWKTFDATEQARHLASILSSLRRG